MRFRDRNEAARILSDAIREGIAEPLENPLVLGVPRGGVPVAAIVADELGGELDVVVTHKLGAPGNPELAIGAVADDGSTVIDDTIVSALGLPKEYVTAERERQLVEVRSRAQRFRAGRAAIEVAGRVVIVVDDGIATGSTVEAAIRTVVERGADLVVAAVPVGPPDSVERIGRLVDHIVCPVQPVSFRAVGLWYDRFDQVSDEQVMASLKAR